MLAVEKSGPFSHAPNSVSQTMFMVLLALVPATLFNLWLFGWPSLFLFLATVLSAVGFEALFLYAAKRPVTETVFDGSAAITGWLLAMSLPPWAPSWIGILGSFIAIVLTKHAYGGLGHNLFNPAMVARVALLVSFPVVMTSWVGPHPLSAKDAPGASQSLLIASNGVPDAMSSATPLGHVKTELSRGIPVSQSQRDMPDALDLFLGLRSGSFGETSALLILLGGLFLMQRRIISWHIPVSVIGSLFLVSTLFNLLDPHRYAGGGFHILSGATFLGAFFIATDYVTSPVSNLGKILFGAGCGLLTWTIRTYAGYPEGMAFAVLLMNSLTPIIDQYTRPRVFGRDRRGEPLPLKHS